MKKHKPLSFSLRRDITGWSFSLLFVLGFLFYFAVPLGQTIIYSFHRVNLELGGYSMEPVGLKNYIFAFQEDQYYKLNIMDSVRQLFYKVPVIIIASLFFAVLLNRKFIGKTFARAVFFIPVIIASGVVIRILKSDYISANIIVGNVSAVADDQQIYSSAGIHDLLVEVGLNEKLVSYFTTVAGSMFDMMWQTGVQTTVFLAGLQTISPSLYEAAHVEGASAWEDFWIITIPMLLPILLVNVVYTVVDLFTDMQNPVMMQIYTLFQNVQIGTSAAMAIPYIVLMSVILMLVVLLFKRISKSR